MIDMRTVRKTVAALAAPLCLMSAVPGWAGPLTMSHGWSVNPAGGKVAIDEAITMMQRSLDSPDFIVLYTTAGYGEQEFVGVLRSRFPAAKLFGMSGYKGVFSSDGLHIGEKGSLAIMGFAGGDLMCGVGISKVTADVDVVSLTKKAVAEAAEDAGKTLADQPAVILLGATKGKEDAIVRGIGESIAGDVALVGGTHCDDSFGQGYAIGNDKICKPGLVVGLIYSQSKIGYSFSSGFIGKKKQGKITEGDGRLLKKIDGRPALDVYREWAEGHFDDIDCSQGSVLVMSSAICPLAKAMELPDGKMRYVPVRPWRFNPDGSLNMGGDIHEGDMVYYVKGNKRALRERARVVARDALVGSRIKMKEIAGGLHHYCGGAAKTLGFDKDGEMNRMVQDVREAMGGRPFIGCLTAGEQGTIEGYGYFHGNLMSTMVIFSEQ